MEEENGVPKRPVIGIDKGSVDSINKELMSIMAVTNIVVIAVLLISSSPENNSQSSDYLDWLL